MAKTTKAIRTTTASAGNPDAALLAMIERRAALWRAVDKADQHDQSLRSGEITIDEAVRRDSECHEACDLEWLIACSDDVHTVEGFHAKCRTVAQSDFETAAFRPILIMLAQQAERLGVTSLPKDLLRRGDPAARDLTIIRRLIAAPPAKRIAIALGRAA